MSILRNRQRRPEVVPQPAHAISVTVSSGGYTSGPVVGLEIRLPERGLLTLDMRMDEAYDLANELLAAIEMAQRKHQQQFGGGPATAF